LLNKTTIAYIIVIISTLIAIVIVAVPMFKTSEQTIEQVATTTSTMSTVPSPLTFASLQALPDWNPTMEVKGMKRVEDNNPELEVKNLPIHTEEIKSNNSSSTFVVKYLEPEVSNEACEKYGLVGKPSEYMSGGHNCLITQPSLFNEIIIISKETGEVLHKYRLEEGYSLTGSLYESESGVIHVNKASDVDCLYISISGWNFLNIIPEPIGVVYSGYKINLVTGEIEETSNTANSPDVINHIPVPSPLTLASLQALPGWNPTMEVEGMKRVEDNNPELEVKNLPIHTEEIKSNNSSSTFVVKYLEPKVSTDACEKYGLVGKPSEYMSGGYNCLITQPYLFNEIIITSKETGEVLHKYRLEEGYSLIGGLNVNPFEIININRFYDVKYLNIFIYEWDHSGTVYKKIGKNHSHKLNMLTGELISVGE
jgi:hypothetical protein